MYTTNKIETFKPAYRQGYEPSRTHLIFCLLISSLFYLTAFANVASGATYYLDAAATGANNGTSWTDAWQSVAAAAMGLDALGDNGSGDTVLVASGDYGTYTENGVIRTDWCTFQAVPGADVNFTYISINNGSYGSCGDSYLKFDGIDIVQSTRNCVDLKYCNYIEITNSLIEPDYVTIDGACEDWYIWNNQFGLRAIQASHVSLDHVTISRCGIAVHITNEGGGNDRGHDWSITNCYIGPLSGIAVYNAGANDVTVFDNRIQECYGLHSEYYLVTGGVTGTLIPGEELVQAVSGAKGQYTYQSSSNVYLYRTTATDFVDGQQVTGQTSGATFTVTNYWRGKSHGEGIYIWSGSDNMQIRRNYINPNKATDGLDIGGGTYAISVVGGVGGAAPIANLVIADNLLVSGKTGDGVLKIYGTASCDIINNTVIGGDFASFRNYSSIKILPGSIPTIIDNFYNNICKLEYGGTEIKNHGNNIFSNNPDGMGSGSYVFTVNGTELVNQNIWSGYFTDYDNLDFTLVAGSNAIDFANASHASVTDVLGVSRVFPPDAGCYEYVSGSPDNTPPLPPTNLISTAQTENSISLSWTAPGPASDGDLASSYKVYRNGTLVSTITNTSFQDSGLAAGISYDYKVYSVDDAGNKSTSAATGTFSTLADTTPPVISSVQTSNVTASQATITWNTNENSTSQVEYGLSASYGNTTNLNSTLVTSHSVVLTWLSPSTTYHYRVKSKDASGNESISQDDTFTTIGVKCSLAVSSTIGGSVTTPGEPGPYQYDQGTEVSIEATEDPNYRFVNWTGTAVNTGKVANPDSASTTVTMDADYTIQANFVVDETDETDPEVTNLSPLADSIQASLNTLVTLSITDSGDGVDADSVTIKVNDNTVYSGNTDKYSSAYGECYRTGTKADYTFIYQSNETFDFDQPISVTVNATDLADNEMAEYSYSFTTEMRSFGENKKVGSDNLNKSSAVTVRDSNGDIWAAWQTGATGSRDIYIGKLAAGAEYFDNSIKIRGNSADQCNPVIAVGSDDKLYVAWQDNRRGNWDIYISTSNDGTNWSAETRITDSNDNQINPAIVVNSSNNAYIVWEDDRNGNDNQDIYVATSNNDFVTKTIAQITSDSSNQAEPAIAADSANTIYIVWTDTRNSKNDIYGAASNNGPWTNIPIVNTGDSQSSPAIAAEAVGSILHLVWVDDRPGDDDIYYAQTDGGLPGSPLTGSSIIDDPDEDQLNPVVAVTGSTGSDLQVFVCWQDERNADDDLYLVEISSGSGTNVFVGDDNTNSGQDDPAIGIDGDGHPYLVWTDSRNTNTDIYYAGSTFAESTVLASNNISTSSTVTVGTPLNAINSVDDVSVVVPAGAYPCDIEIIISKITNPLAFAMQCLGAYDFGPSGIDFSQSVTVTIPYNYTGSEDVALAYWYNSLTDALSQQGITDVETIEVSSSLHALRFKTTHFTPFYVFLVSAGGAAASGGGGGGGCSMSPDSQASVVELILPYIGLTVAMVVLKMRDRRKRKALNITKSEC